MAVQVTETFNVKDFGAKGNGIADDYKAIQDCIDAALKTKSSKILFPAGKYQISKTLIAHYLDNQLEITGLREKGELPLIFSKATISLLAVRGYIATDAVGTIAINNIELKGGFGIHPYGKMSPFILKDVWYYGISITDKRTVRLENLSVSDIYGEGIYISTTAQTGIPVTARFDSVEINGCKVLNCWGYNPALDDYGDGIYISNVASAKITGNLIHNDFTQTKQLGRCGIVLEFMAENCVVASNDIFGYDRGIHLEADYGGHQILNNKLSGSDMGIVLENDPIEGHNNPVVISGNLITNKGLPKGNSLNRVRDITALSDRSLLNFVARGGSRAGSIIEKNRITIDGNYDYFSNTIVNIKADDIKINDNLNKVLSPGKLKYLILYNNYSNSISKNDDFSGIRILKYRKEKIGDVKKISKTNRMNSTQIELNL
ncbi:right-handed parallel beta-helix repeat-containing protein [Pedobacter antarcticus]|uniref:right-handed parallel beta-helix repeat-containing protein n=1 Tax=Pedobacter antarcticus TaxID=34086 RepID=UPI0015A4199A|nr:glycosyl hydrolase family 28-related protein [Pedobacter antarcticus]